MVGVEDENTSRHTLMYNNLVVFITDRHIHSSTAKSFDVWLDKIIITYTQNFCYYTG